MHIKWGAIAVSVLIVVIFGMALVFTALKLIPDSHDILVALLAQVQAVISYWLGSSASSKAKDDIIARSPPVDPPSQ